MNQLEISKFPPLEYAPNEAFNTLATSLFYCGVDTKTILVTSRYAAEGKSYVSMNLMRTLASLNKRVVLLDTDLRRSGIIGQFRVRFDTTSPMGLAQYLAGMCRMDKDNFEYTVSATMGGKTVAVTEGENGSYTIAKVTGNLVITVEKKSVSTMNVAVSKFVEMDNKTVFLVTVTGTPEEGKAFAYGENVMYKTTAYGENVYSWLVIVDGTDLTAADAEAKITQSAAEAEEVAAGYDVNETGVVDINDAQLTYDIYTGKYTDFEKVSVRKFLRADTNADKVVNSADAVAVVANSN